MLELIFDPTNYIVTQGVNHRELLAKEFALLQFLYENRNRTFTRGQLLDRVWPLEYPVERTVDDHIYRLRKKLKHWEGITINTVRGYGYSLTIAQPNRLDNPSMNDKGMKETISSLFKKYQRFGQGKSMLTLSSQQDILGFEIDPFYRIYIHFIQGDISWFTNSEDIPVRERLYWMLLLYRAARPHPEQMLNFCKRVLSANLLPYEQHRELDILNIIDVYAEADKTAEAIEKFAHTHLVVREQGLDGFVMAVELAEMYVYLLAGNLSEAEQKVAKLEELLQQTPYLREIGRFLVLKGLWLLTIGERNQAIVILDEGIDVIKMTLNIHLLLISVCQIIFYLEQQQFESALLGKYKTIYETLDKEYGLTKHKASLEKMIESALLSV
ncbi:winged helix-turn-helix domain-containing protein [Paenibacillus sp. L3-i20]|uniref:winged helix-turn-helix domain-containing protein n=1 Tax=Paenibacillus sp. L3-i20 TaxID=2905833 RepID=UPI001EDFA5A9|nr:winged helix-turn-helix domain-containing protein [Paenibacillus sp. L3-i20]GKU77834.1 hypothetical protein L3i20_v222310 [Paenibacillus sp. L3-i20]